MSPRVAVDFFYQIRSDQGADWSGGDAYREAAATHYRIAARQWTPGIAKKRIRDGVIKLDTQDLVLWPGCDVLNPRCLAAAAGKVALAVAGGQ